MRKREIGIEVIEKKRSVTVSLSERKLVLGFTDYKEMFLYKGLQRVMKFS